MAVRTGGPGAGGLSLILVPLKDYPGVSMRRFYVSGMTASGTTYIELDDVKVPVENLIGQEGQGMKNIMTNFNHERLAISIGVTRQARVALSAAFEYCLKREAFGKVLMDQPVVRHRLAKAGAELETISAWVEQFLYQLNNMSKEQADVRLGGLTALAKAKGGMVLNECAQVAVLLFGGNGLTKAGQGEIVESMPPSVLLPVLPLSAPSPVSRIYLCRNSAKLTFSQKYCATSQEPESPGVQKMSSLTFQCGSLLNFTRRKQRHLVRRRCNDVTCQSRPYRRRSCRGLKLQRVPCRMEDIFCI